MTPVIAEVRVVDDPEAWRAAGFTVASGGRVTVGRTHIRLVADDAVSAARPGIAGWALSGVATPLAEQNGGTIDGLPTEIVPADGETEPDDPEATPGPAPRHPNGVVRIDHVVVLTPDLDRTTAAFHAIGLEPRRTREAGPGPDGVPRRQRFFRLGEVILEVVGPATATGAGPARFWGLAYVVDDLDATAGGLGERLSRPREAIQPGRRIAALRPSAGLAVPTAFLTPDPREAARL